MFCPDPDTSAREAPAAGSESVASLVDPLSRIDRFRHWKCVIYGRGFQFPVVNICYFYEFFTP